MRAPHRVRCNLKRRENRYASPKHRTLADRTPREALDARVAMDARALARLSDGQDAATCLAWALACFAPVKTIGFDHGQRPQSNRSAGVRSTATCVRHLLPGAPAARWSRAPEHGWRTRARVACAVPGARQHRRHSGLRPGQGGDPSRPDGAVFLLPARPMDRSQNSRQLANEVANKRAGGPMDVGTGWGARRPNGCAGKPHKPWRPHQTRIVAGMAAP